MKFNPKISAAVAAVLSAPTTVIVMAAPADQATSAAEATGGLAEVVVTAERRTESVQDVPITVQAITGDQLTKLNVTNFNDLLKYTPNVTYSGNGPGTGNIFMRGLGGIGSGNQSQTTTAAFPNVGLFLDEQSMQFPARNNDPYLVDMERVEVLEGPQGTLFGGSAQAGAIRYITNKPNLGATSGSFNAGYGYTAGGENNSQLNAVLNVPLIPNVLGLRAVVFNERQGGYISNLPSTIAYPPGSVGATIGGNPSANNASLLKNDANPVTYQGMRFSLLWKFADNWDFLLQQNYQDLEADGWFYAYPADPNGTTLAPYQITAFQPAYTKDRYESTSVTINGQITDDLHLLYAGNYLVRHIEGQQDYSNYLRSTFGSYYGCIGPGALYFNSKTFPALVGKKTQCYAPLAFWTDKAQNYHQSHELRLTTNENYRLRGIFGAYWEKFVIYDQQNYGYGPIPKCDPATLAAVATGGPDCLSAIGPLPGTFATDPGLRLNSETAFGQDLQRGYKQTAFYGSVDFDLVPKVLTVSAGTRWFHYDDFEYGSRFTTETTSPLIVDHPNGACTATGACGFPINLHKTESGTRSRFNLAWHITRDVMTYYTFSQGYRPGGFNRTKSLLDGSVHLAAEVPFCTFPLVGGVPTKTCIPNSSQYEKPAGWQADNLINNEIGLKSEFLDHRVLFNLSLYYMKWKDQQLSLFAPTILGNTTFNVNGPDFTIKGFEVQFVARLTEGLTFEGSSSVNSSTQSTAPCLESVGVDPNNPKTANNPTPKGECVVVNSPQGPVPNALGAYGTPPPWSPPWMFNARLRYDWHAADYHPFIWAGASHVGPMTNEPRNYFPASDPKNCCQPSPITTLLQYPIPSYTSYDGAIGVTKDNWTAQIFGSNLSNVYGPTNVSSGQFIKSEIPLRPRVVNFVMSYVF
jgi:outer membrane receptor protein involved in Fe transport